MDGGGDEKPQSSPSSTSSSATSSIADSYNETSYQTENDSRNVNVSGGGSMVAGDMLAAGAISTRGGAYSVSSYSIGDAAINGQSSGDLKKYLLLGALALAALFIFKKLG